ncbi:MAG: hypothetical protein ACREBG_02330 [Pyrinomonadaceae bacterium]
MSRIVPGLILIGFSVLIACVSSVPSSSSTPPSAHSLKGNELEQKSVGTSEQVKFGAEESIQHPVSIPHTVLQILRRDKRIKLRLAREDAPNDILTSWFTASEIALNDDDLPDLIIQGTEATLMGANLVPFWVLAKTHEGPAPVLHVDALGLEVLRTRTNTYRDIRASRATATDIITTTYTFDGSRYRAHHTVREKIAD